MNCRTLGKSGIQVSEIGIGAWQLGGPLVLDGKVDGHPELGREFCVDLIRQCGDLGINFVDTAEQYGNGESERRVGEALRGRRQKWIISTKFGHQVGPNGERLRDASPKRAPVSLEGSLKRLQTDYVDVYLYHIAPLAGEAEETVKFLESAKKRGQVRAVGISTNSLKDAEFLDSLGCLDVIQFSHSMLDPPDPIIPFVARHELGGVVRGSFAGGRLSGKYFHRKPKFGPDDIRSGRFPDSESAAADFARYAVFEELLTPRRGMIQLALRHLLDEPTTHVIIPGGKSTEDYRQAIRATEIPPLSPEEKLRVEELKAGLLKRQL
ncbi:MAG: aldo/keto reductase [Verrucomicrobiae bacterium]